MIEDLLTVEFLLPTVSLLFFCVIYLLITTNIRANLIAASKTKLLSKALEQYVKIFEGAPVPYITVDKGGKIINPNKAALRFFGVTREEIVGQNLFYYQPQEDLERAEKLFGYYKSNIPINNEEVRFITKNGDTKWTLFSVFKMDNPENRQKIGLGTVFDISERKQLEKAKSEFVSLISHQLRTPVATTKWFGEMLLSGQFGELNDTQMDYMERIYKVNENMAELTETLLDISRIESGTLKIKEDRVNVQALVESILFELTAQIELKKLNIVKNFGGNLDKIKSDKKLLRIAVQNLISNAVKYSKEGGEIRITLKESLGGKEIMVADNGIGIPERDRDKIFSKLFRASNADSVQGGQGSGLGLYLVKSVAEALGGEILFSSKEGEGSTFVIKL